MHFCKTKRHVWSKKEDAQKCCNGYKRVLVYGGDVPKDVEKVNTDPETGMVYARIWVKKETTPHEMYL